MVQMTVLPLLERSMTVFMILSAVFASSPLVGSSRNKMEGFVIISTPILTRLRSPPEIPLTTPGTPIFVFAHLDKPSSSMVASTRRSFSRRDSACGKRNMAEKINVSRTVKLPIRMSSC